MLKRIFIFCLFILFSMSVNLLAEKADLDYILEQIRLAQKNMDIPDDVICTYINTCQELNKKGEVTEESIIEKRIYRKEPDKYYEEYISIIENGEEFSKAEIEEETKKENSENKNSENEKTEKKSFSIFSMFDEDMTDIYTFNLLGDDTFNDIPVWVIEFKANEKKEEYVNGNAFISKETYNILRIEVSPTKNPSKVKEMSNIFIFNEIDGYLLFERMQIDIKAGFLFVFNKHIVVITTYSDYQINTGLEDSFFEERKSE